MYQKKPHRTTWKIPVIKSSVVPLIVHLLIFLPNPYKITEKMIDKMLNSFLWNNGPDKEREKQDKQQSRDARSSVLVVNLEWVRQKNWAWVEFSEFRKSLYIGISSAQQRYTKFFWGGCIRNMEKTHWKLR